MKAKWKQSENIEVCGSKCKIYIEKNDDFALNCNYIQVEEHKSRKNSMYVLEFFLNVCEMFWIWIDEFNLNRKSFEEYVF